MSRTRQEAPAVDRRFSRAEEPASRSWWQQPATLAAAFFLVAALGLGALAGVQWQRADEAQQRADRIAAVATDPDRVENSAAGTTGGSGTVIAADDLAVFRTDDLPELPADQAYQLWLIDDDGATSVGVLGRGGQLEMVMDDVSGADSVGLTVEPASRVGAADRRARPAAPARLLTPRARHSRRPPQRSAEHARHTGARRTDSQRSALERAGFLRASQSGRYVAPN